MGYNQHNFDWSLTDRKIAVFIPNYRRKIYVEATMRYFKTRLNPSDYIIVVGNDGVDEDFSRLSSSNVVSFTLTRHPGPRNGCFIRNFFIRRCKSKVIFQRDPEIIITEDFMSKIADLNANSVYRVGRAIKTEMKIGKMLLRGIDRNRIPALKSSFRRIDPGKGTFLHWGFAAPTALLQEMHGYDEGYLEYGYEDTDLFSRLLNRGVAFNCDFDTYAIHMWHPTDVDIKGSQERMKRLFHQKCSSVFVRNGESWGNG